MVPLCQETNIEILREYALNLEERVKSLIRENSRLKDERELAKQEWLESSLRDTLHRLQKKFYGFGRESLPRQSDIPRKVGHEDAQLNLHSERKITEEVRDPKQNQNSPSQARNRQSPLEEIHDFRDEDLQEESGERGVVVGKDAWKKIPGLVQESSVITVTERTYQKVVHKQLKYRLKDKYNTTGKEVIITAPGPVKVRPNSRYSVDFALAVVTDKYEMHLPLERQRRKMEAAGLEVDVKTLYGLCEAVAEHGKTVLEGIRQDILTDFCAAHLDETPWKILSEKKQGYLWVISNRVGCYYQFEPTRSGKVPEEMLKGYDGAIITDAYSGYNRVEKNLKVRVQRCFSHARREFYERYEDYPHEVTQVLTLIDRLFEIEAKAKSPEQLKELRRTESKQTVDELREWLYLNKPRFLPSEGISKAILYCLKNWQELTHFLTDLTVEIQNNDAERALRHAVIGRKNYAGSKTINGADTAAILFTLIETCKRNCVQPADYLKYLITERWYQRQPKTPFQYAAERFGLSQKVIWPDRSNWQI